ncbi:DUF962 domain-containing protein [bacterium]|jgi:hypothetical protein|nr:DUF962 domain-containing protein [Planctomicrobium sp.]MDA7504212.1 DUF962 domain-containing protein [bacterium]
MADPLPDNFSEFWELYLSEHQSLLNRWLHTTGTILSIMLFVFCFISKFYWGFLFVPLVGYGGAWFGHYFIEKNRPLSLRAPVRSLLCDYRLALMMALGQNNKLVRPSS